MDEVILAASMPNVDRLHASIGGRECRQVSNHVHPRHRRGSSQQGSRDHHRPSADDDQRLPVRADNSPARESDVQVKSREAEVRESAIFNEHSTVRFFWPVAAVGRLELVIRFLRRSGVAPSSGYVVVFCRRELLLW